MATREHRIAAFSNAHPHENVAHELLCEDHAGTYVLPYPCRWKNAGWTNEENDLAIQARVVGWRLWEVASA